MGPSRRAFLRMLLIVLGGSVFARSAWAGQRRRIALPNGQAAGESRLSAAIRAEIGDARPMPSEGIRLELPTLAEDGAVVPVTLESSLPSTRRLLLYVEKNPFPLAAAFEFAAGGEPYVSLRIKVNESCDVIALAEAGGRYYSVKKPVRVVIGGCG